MNRPFKNGPSKSLALEFLQRLVMSFGDPAKEDYQEDKFVKLKGIGQYFMDNYGAYVYPSCQVDDSLEHLGFIDFYFADGSRVELDFNKKRAFFLT